MEDSPQSNDSELAKFDQWLSKPAVQPPAGLLLQVRAHLREFPDVADETIDQLLHMDPSLRNPQMLARVRAELEQETVKQAFPFNWFNWITPLAAAATLTLAFISFQSQAPRPATMRPHSPAVVQESIPGVQPEDDQLTQIFALASNLHGATDMTKLESVENLAFLFD